jgi:threonine synthase
LRDLPETGRPSVIAATASPWKFPVTMLRALTGKTVSDEFAAAGGLAALTGETPALADLKNAPILHDAVTFRDTVPETICRTFSL